MYQSGPKSDGSLETRKEGGFVLRLKDGVETNHQHRLKSDTRKRPSGLVGVDLHIPLER